MNKKTKEKGITLVALVVTMIVLLILAGVAINLVAGGDGIMAKAQSALITNNIAEAKERVNLKIAEFKTDFYRAVYVEKSVSVNTELGDWIAQTQKDKTIGAGDYEFKITIEENEPLYKITIFKNNRIKESIVGEMDSTGKIEWADETGKDIVPEEPEVRKYTVTYYANEGIGTVPASAEYEKGNEVTVDFSAVLSRDGYNFIGWAETQDATVATYTKGGTETFELTSNVKLYAVWEAKLKVPEGLEIGSIVNYTPSGTYTEWTAEHSGNGYGSGGVSYNFASGNLYTGESGQTKMTISSWKVFKIIEETGEIQLVPSKPNAAGTAPFLGRTNGYNNAVKLLNDACSNLYSKPGVTARNINIKDIESVLNYDKKTYQSRYSSIKYGDQSEDLYTKTNSRYPIIYQKEINSVIYPEPVNTIKSLDESSQVEWFSGLGSSEYCIQPYQTAYELSSSDFSSKLNNDYSNILLPLGENTSYWIASRGIDCCDDFCLFGVFRISQGKLVCEDLTDSYIHDWDVNAWLFPIVTFSISLIEGDTINGWSVK